MTWVAFRAALLQWPPLFRQFDKFAAGNAFPISGFVAFGTGVLGVLGVLWWLGGWVVGIRYRRGPTGVRNMRAVLKKASSGTRRIFRDIGAQNRLLRYRWDIRYQKPPSLVRNESTGCGGLREMPLLAGGRHQPLSSLLPTIFVYLRVRE